MRVPVDDWAGLLRGTSRTFAVTIPLLPEPLATDVTLAYLLFRAADTLEDHPRLSAAEKQAELARLDGWLDGERPGRSPIDAPLGRGVASDDPACDDLLARVPALLAAVADRGPAVRRVVVGSVRRTIDGMRAHVAAADEAGRIELSTLVELRSYCYLVAGLVGEMLTELFLLRVPGLAPAAEALRRRAAAFGEALQLVNILKDVTDDEDGGRRWLPASVPAETVFELARADLARAADYVAVLRRAGAPGGVVAFAELPRRLAERTLAVVEQAGPGRKVSRAEVAAIVASVRRDCGLTDPTPAAAES